MLSIVGWPSSFFHFLYRKILRSLVILMSFIVHCNSKKWNLLTILLLHLQLSLRYLIYIYPVLGYTRMMMIFNYPIVVGSLDSSAWTLFQLFYFQLVYFHFYLLLLTLLDTSVLKGIACSLVLGIYLIFLAFGNSTNWRGFIDQDFFIGSWISRKIIIRERLCDSCCKRLSSDQRLWKGVQYGVWFGRNLK